MKRNAILLFSVLILFIATYYSVEYFRAKRINSYLDSRISLMNNNYSSAIASYESVLRDIFVDKIDTYEVKTLIKSAVSDPENRDKYRRRLQMYVLPYYESMSTFGLKHMHFHFADGTSFLRMHRPDTYGDQLFDFRSTVKSANEEKHFVKGFENGRHLLAYRFVFPLDLGGEHLGSMEMSVGLKEVTSSMNRLFGGGYSYLLEKQKLFKSYTLNTVSELEEFSLNDEYILDSCEACEDSVDDSCLLDKEEVAEAVKEIIKENINKIKSFQEFSKVVSHKKDIHFIFYPVTDTQGNGYGYIISHKDIGGYSAINRFYDIFMFFAFALLTVIFITIFVLLQSRQKTIEANENLERKVQEKVQELQEKEQFFAQQSKMVTMGEMLSSILHQWKQPLNSITLLADLLIFECQRKSCDQEIASQLADIKKQAMFMSHTGDDFRNFLKPSKEKNIFSLVESVEEVINLFDFSFARYNTTFKTVWDENVRQKAFVLGYGNEFKHVLLNIFNNARDAIVARREELVEQGENVAGFKGYITVTITEEESKVVVRVEDTGGGIPDNIIKSIFNKDFTTKKDTGSGIGLFMSKEIVEKTMNGTISVHNSIEGAVFTMEFPKPD